MFRSLQRAAHCGPLSLVIEDSTPNRCIQPVNSAAAQSAAAVDNNGIASGHLVVQSMTVNRWVKPADFGSGPIKNQHAHARSGGEEQECVPVPVLHGVVLFLADSPCRSEPPP